MNHPVTIAGGGLAGCEAALQLAAQGIPVHLYEMRPHRKTPAHKTGSLAELVCSNSMKGLALTSAHGLLKEELKRLGSCLLPLAFESRVAAGESLALDRELFSSKVSEAIDCNPLIHLVREELTVIPEKGLTLIASGPLTSDALSAHLSALLGAGNLAFFDSIAPVVTAESLCWDHVYAANRWDKGETPDFLNCPLDKTTYEELVEALREADTVEAKPFEKGELFEGCLPVEELARRGMETLRYGPMRPIGLPNPSTGEIPHAVIQLRAENGERTLYNLVGFQTRLKWPTQKRIFGIVPALREAEFVRLGAMHRNTFIDSPKLLSTSLELEGKGVYFAGQITGAEGYTEALATGLYTSSMLAARLRGDKQFKWPEASATASLVRHLTSPNPGFQPMNFNFGLLPKVAVKRKADRKQKQIEACLSALENFLPFGEDCVSKSIPYAMSPQ